MLSRKNLFLIILLCAFLSACSTAKKTKTYSAKNTKRPSWIFEPDTKCKSYELCAVGEAPGTLGADVAARKNLAKIFETKVKSQLNVNTTATSQTRDQVVTGTVDEDVREQIQEQTDQVLKGVEIKEIYEGKEAYFAFAVLDKRQAAKRIASEIDAVDTELVAFYNDGRRSSLSKALKKYYLRNNLNERHEFLSGRRISPPVSLRGILNKKRKKRELGTTVKVRFEEVGGISEVNHLIISHLLANDFKVVTEDQRGSQYSILGSLKREKQHMNVKGFERYKFFLQLKSQDKNGVKIGALEFDTIQTGRNLQHAYENAMPEIRAFLDDKLSELNID